jgi:hypothetical protein
MKMISKVYIFLMTILSLKMSNFVSKHGNCKGKILGNIKHIFWILHFFYSIEDP